MNPSPLKAAGVSMFTMSPMEVVQASSRKNGGSGYGIAGYDLPTV
jgi:hypothetical protein